MTMKHLLAATALVALSVPALAQSNAPPAGKTINDYYKQNVYNPKQDKIGSVEDMLTSERGQITALIISVDGKDVAVPFEAVRPEMKNDKWYLTLNTSEDQLKSAQALT